MRFLKPLNLMSFLTTLTANELIMFSFPHAHFNRYALLLLLSFSGANTLAFDIVTIKDTVSIQNAWVRPTNPGQEVGAAYMTILSSQDTELIGVESDVTKSVEIHSMTIQNGVMRMRMLNTLPLVAGKPYKLAPGGFHLMLFDLKKPLAVGEKVNFVLHFKNKNAKNKNHVEFKQKINAMVQSSLEDTASKSPH